MTTRKKVVSVARKTTVEDKLNSVRWTEFVKASGTPFLSLSKEWLAVFDAQSEIETASSELERLVDHKPSLLYLFRYTHCQNFPQHGCTDTYYPSLSI